MNKKESFEEYKKIYIEGCKQHIPWRLDDAIEMFSAFPVHTELMHADLKDKYEKLLAEKDKEIERHAKTKAGVSWASYEVRSKQVIDLEKQLESAREIITGYNEGLDMDSAAYDWLNKHKEVESE